MTIAAVAFVVLAADPLVASTAAAGAANANGANGVYGGVALTGLVEPFGAGDDVQRKCQDLGAADCSNPPPLGGGFTAWAGLARGAWGYEVFFGVLGDYHHPSAHYDGKTHVPDGDPLLSTPPRDETFILVRAGGMIAARVRRSWNGPRWRPSLALGAGVAWRYVALEREVTTTPATGGLEDRPYFPTGTTYVSPGVSAEAQLAWRATPTLAVTFTLGGWIESAWSSTRSAADPDRAVSGNGQTLPIATPAYEIAHGLQFFVLPSVGLAFGP